MIIGGWQYIYAAYIVTASVLTLYITSVVLRYRRERNNDLRRSGESL
jgi:hypothetical protein